MYADLIKARLTLLVLLTTLVGFYIGLRGPMDYVLMFHAMFGTALVASGAAALNQLLEREYDAKMRRTAEPPAAVGPVAAGDGDVVRRRVLAGGVGVSGAAGESADECARRGFAGQLSVSSTRRSSG